MQDFRLGLFRPVISEVVAAEIEHAPREVLERYFELLELEPEYAEINPEVERLVAAYMKICLGDGRKCDMKQISRKFYIQNLVPL